MMARSMTFQRAGEQGRSSGCPSEDL
uniref:Uncharacterized protein n=1 Tax=Anguilla anguilla TaxID=7936 RepID=A0A0E9RJZ7_ANGAN